MSKYCSRKIYHFLLIIILFSSCSEDKLEDDLTGKSSRKTVIETGELAAVNSKAFVLGRYGYWHQMKIIGILEHGAIVNAGDSIIQLDPTDINKFIIDRESDLETQLAALETMNVNQENKNREYESKIRSELATFELRKIDLESSKFESERIRKVKELQFEQAKITLEKEKRRLKLNQTIDANNFKIQEIRVRQMEDEIKNAYAILPELTIRTPISGVFQIAWNWRVNSMLKVGDQIYAGNNMANVPELKYMKVNTFINENDFLKIRLGQKVAIRLDAMPKEVFDGEISYIGKLCHRKDQKSREKVFDVEVKISKPDERLKPGMTVSCEFLESN